MIQLISLLQKTTSPAGFWTFVSWVCAIALHFAGGASQNTQQIVDAAVGVITSLHVAGTHFSNAKAGATSPTNTANPFK